MRFGHGWFNPFFLAALLMLFAQGCATPEEKEKRKEASTLRFYMETDIEEDAKSALVPVVRSNPVVVRIEKTAFLDEGSLKDAAVIETLGGFAIQVKLDFHGTLVLENVTTSYKGRRMVIYSMFTQGRWLAAPQISDRISDGVFTFTPDASREEADRIVRGLINVAVKLGNRSKTDEPPKKK